MIRPSLHLATLTCVGMLGCFVATEDPPVDETGSTGDGDGDPTGDGDGDPTGDGDGDGDPTGDGDGDPTGDGDGCGSAPFDLEYMPPNVMWVVDTSGSMISNTWDHDLNPMTPSETRWKTFHGAIQTVMQQSGASINAGIKRFPSESACDPNPCYNETACITTEFPELGVAPNNGAAILAAIPGADDDGTSVEGGTPATLGINSAVSYLNSLSTQAPRYILFVTDGAANCTPGFVFPAILESYDETLIPTVQAARDSGIKTFVVGIEIVDALTGVGPDGSPEANPYQRLNELALAGGVPKNMGVGAEKFFNTTNQSELLAALGGILDQIADCVVDLNNTEDGPPSPDQIPHVEFTADGQVIPYVANCPNANGWTWIEQGVSVAFCGAYCDNFKAGVAAFEGLYGCSP